jgi:hypothetical protein
MKRSIAVAALSGLLLVTAACGSDEDSSSATEAPAETEAPEAASEDGESGDTEAPEATEAATDVSMPDLSDITIPDLSDITIPDLSDISLPAGLPPECEAYATAYLGIFAAVFGGGEVDIDASDEAFGDLRDQVPDELKDDVDVLAASMQPILDVLAEYDFDFTKIMSDPEAAGVDRPVRRRPGVGALAEPRAGLVGLGIPRDVGTWVGEGQQDQRCAEQPGPPETAATLDREGVPPEAVGVIALEHHQVPSLGLARAGRAARQVDETVDEVGLDRVGREAAAHPSPPDDGLELAHRSAAGKVGAVRNGRRA